MIKPISIFFRNGVVSQFLTITFKIFGFRLVYSSKGNRNLHDIPRFKALSHGERCVERRDNATNGINRTLKSFHTQSERLLEHYIF